MRRRVLIMLAALVLAGLSAASVAVYAKGVDERAVAGKEAVWVLLATKRIPAGTTGARIRSEHLAERVQMPAASVPDGALTTIDSAVAAQRLDGDLAPQQLLLRGQFAPATEAGSAAVGVPAGQLAVSVEVTMAPGVAEKIAAGDQVTVFVTYPMGVAAGAQQTRVLLPNALVLSITTGAEGDVAPSPSPSRRGTQPDSQFPATLAVSPKDSVRLVHAAQTGLLYLGLVGSRTVVSPAPAVDYSKLWQ
jgi:pilus assembly protein CpaB